MVRDVSAAFAGFNTVGASHQQPVRRSQGKEAVGDHTGNVVDPLFQIARGGDRVEVVHVENDIAVVGNGALAVVGPATEFDQLAGDVAASHGNDLNRQRELTEEFHTLGLVDDADEFVGDVGNDLFPRQRAAAALDQFKVGVDLVRAIDIQAHFADGVEIVNRDLQLAQPLGRGLRAGNGAGERDVQPGQHIDEVIGC